MKALEFEARREDGEWARLAAEQFLQGYAESDAVYDQGGSRLEWYGFKPLVRRRPVWAGFVEIADREEYINHYVRFGIPDLYLDKARAMIFKDYGRATYAVGVKDCVSMSADVARVCRLRLHRVNMTPFGLIWILKCYNAFTDYDTRPYPWKPRE